MLLVVNASSFSPMNLVKIDIRPPNKRVVINTTIRVELTIKPLLGDKEGRICKLKANAIAPILIIVIDNLYL